MVTEFVLDHKWYFFIAGEVIFWGSLIGFLLLRYAFNLIKLSKYLIFLWLLSDLWLATIGVLDYMRTGHLNQFQIIIGIALIYALTAGKKDFKRLDRWIQRKVAVWKGEEPPKSDDKPERRLYGKEHAKSERKKFYVHFFLFVAAHFAFALFFDYVPSEVVKWLRHLDVNFSLNDESESISRISAIWVKVLIIDFIWSFSYTIWPKKEKKG
ncbi:hypothetical protein GCM10007416_06860 [Kroppenstedtia guangzhouensis]|uniref:Integral membrane protein n=1 Tax=Kroppenstedtia guangzhouensis TaxID=1274356 RepID=A0ABQ1G4P7_9BACL|nr:hypothetical protein GCM10007416_06860 [Kroppenstedtia guangzhouensis]